MTPRLLLLAAVVALATPAAANDSTAQLGAGGIELVRNENVELLAEFSAAGPLASLNVSNAAAICLFALSHQAG